MLRQDTALQQLGAAATQVNTLGDFADWLDECPLRGDAAKAAMRTLRGRPVCGNRPVSPGNYSHSIVNR